MIIIVHNQYDSWQQSCCKIALTGFQNSYSVYSTVQHTWAFVRFSGPILVSSVLVFIHTEDDAIMTDSACRFTHSSIQTVITSEQSLGQLGSLVPRPNFPKGVWARDQSIRLSNIRFKLTWPHLWSNQPLSHNLRILNAELLVIVQSAYKVNMALQVTRPLHGGF